MTNVEATLTRRSLLGGIGTSFGLAALGGAIKSGAGSEYWTVVALPDTQFYAEDKSGYLRDQTEWIANNLGAENIAFVSHEGDLVENGDDETEWQHIDDGMTPLDGTVPYATLPGNHDWATVNDRSSSIKNYKTHFGPDRYTDYGWFGGAGPDVDDSNRANLNTYQLFSAGGYDFLHLALEWEPPGTVDDPETPLGWAQSVLDDHPDYATILTTHSYLRDDTGDRARDVQEVDGDGNAAQTVWEELIAPNGQIFAVLGGHWHEDDGEERLVSTNEAGDPVYQMVADYQERANGGNGFLRRIEFRPGHGTDAPDRIQVRTYSPSSDEFETDGDSKFAFDLDFEVRFGGDDPTERVSFEEGVDGYDGTVDVGVREATPDSSDSSAATATIDADDPEGSGDAAQYLLRFGDVVGTADDQVPPGATIEDATLSLETTDEGDGAAVHRMLTGWGVGTTWASLDGGVDADGGDAVEASDAETGPTEIGTTHVDVTASVRAWVDGATNDGWGLLPLGGDGWDVDTADADDPPRLSITYMPPTGTIEGDADGDGDVDRDDVRRIQRYIAGDDVDIDREAADVDDDGDVDIGDAVAVSDMIGDGS